MQLFTLRTATAAPPLSELPSARVVLSLPVGHRVSDNGLERDPYLWKLRVQETCMQASITPPSLRGIPSGPRMKRPSDPSTRASPGPSCMGSDGRGCYAAQHGALLIPLRLPTTRATMFRSEEKAHIPQ